MTRNHAVRIGAWVPAWTLSAFAGVVALAATAMLHPSLPATIVVLATVTAGAVFPRTFLAWAPLAPIALALLAEDAAPARTAVALLATHAVHTCASVTCAMRARSRVSPAALRPTLVRFIALQAPAQALALVLGLVGGAVDARIAGAAITAAVLIAAVSVTVMMRADRRRT